MSGPRALHILLVTKGLGMGGAERVLLQTAKVLRDQSCTFAILNIDAGRLELGEEAALLGIPVVSMPFKSAFSPGQVIRCLRWMKAQGFDLMHAHLPMAGVYARMLGLLSGLPVVYTEHSLVTKYRPLTRLLSRLSYHWNAQTIAVSQAVRDSIEAAYGPRHASRCQVIANGLDLAAIEASGAQGPAVRAELGIRAESRVVGTVASFRPVKRLDLLIRAFARLGPDLDTVLVLVGYGDIRVDLERLAGELGIAHRVVFTGMRRDALRYLRSMDVFVICSDWEGLPLALLEAMTLSRPIIATRVGGIPEMVVDGVSGRLVQANDEDALAAALAELVRAPELAARLGQGARQAIGRQAGLQEMSVTVRDVYQRVLANA